MPNDYYVSQYSGEEIDALLGGAGAGTVRYDAAQSLTDEQKAQARTNIGAAPSGYGYGGKSTGITFWDDTDGSKLKTHLENMYADYGDTIIRTKLVDYPICKVAGNGGWADIYFGNDPNVKTIIVRFHAVNQSIIGPSVATLMCKDDVWGEWEYENPPMQLGVEYRTTERYLGKPVYVQLMDWGNAPTQGTMKAVAVPENSADQQLIWAELTYYGITFPKYNADGTLSMFIYVSQGTDQFQVYSPGEDRSDNGVIQALVKYTKKTAGSTKEFKLTVDDTGAVSATEVTT